MELLKSQSVSHEGHVFSPFTVFESGKISTIDKINRDLTIQLAESEEYVEIDFDLASQCAQLEAPPTYADNTLSNKSKVCSFIFFFHFYYLYL